MSEHKVRMPVSSAVKSGKNSGVCSFPAGVGSRTYAQADECCREELTVTGEIFCGHAPAQPDYLLFSEFCF